ncbi:hypothetical protein EYF80_020511 [Liparis tanakae]|uniref:Uncharacterized protein n=1 Tax=Liparis tanakae TaxID=230148 RepID=A0A4Z2HW02_9TELE|nr:hypothetical protein EYF80_020511 [Liparis tanakae]
MDSGDFCSLNLPSNTPASSSMSKAHTAEPGMLQRRRGERESLPSLRTAPRPPRASVESESGRTVTFGPRRSFFHFSGALPGEEEEEEALLFLTSERKKQTMVVRYGFPRKDVHCFSRTRWEPPRSRLHTRDTRDTIT